MSSLPSAVGLGRSRQTADYFRGAVDAVRALWFSRGDHVHAQRAAGTAFLIRIANAAVAFFSQVLLARWMGSHEFGIYVYVWTWLVLVGGVIDFGLGTTAQRLVPEYTEAKTSSLLRGFLTGSRWATGLLASIVAGLGAIAIKLLEPWLSEFLVLPLYLACIALPLYGLNVVQDGIARSYNWVMLALLPMYIVRPLMMLGLILAAHAAGASVDAATAMIVAVVATWATALLQSSALNRRLRGKIERGPKSFEFGKWISISLPVFFVTGFYYLLTFMDVLVLQAFRPPSEIAIYFAATKVIALVAFIYFSVTVAVAHKFAQYNATGDRNAIAGFLAESIRWTFWPSLAATIVVLALGEPILGLFGAEYVQGYPLLAILAIGHLARAAVGPVERLLNMLGEQKVCAMVYAGACALNLMACLVLIPRFGVAGAAMAISLTLVAESATLFWITKVRLGYHPFIWNRRKAGRDGAGERPALQV